MDDLFDEFMEYDFTMGADVVKCPHCGADVPCSLFFDNEVGMSGMRKEVPEGWKQKYLKDRRGELKNVVL